MRLDQYLVFKNMAQSRTQAQDFIENGFVFLLKDNKKILLSKPSYTVDESQNNKIEVIENKLQKYVSRAGLKLESAIESLKLNINNKTVLDIGQSTGGFTDCLLRRGARHVVGVDVGHGQLHPSIRNHTQVAFFEGLNAKDLATDRNFCSSLPPEKFDMIVMDVSFISATKVIPFIKEYLKPMGEFLFLIKPQFECGPEYLDKNGIVNDLSVYSSTEDMIKKIILQNFNNVEAYIKSELIGKDGNQEFFVYGKNNI